MKNVTLLVALAAALASPLLLAQSSSQPMLSQGTKELALSGTIEMPEFEEIDFDIDASYGFFIKDGWEIGVRVLGSDLGGIERFDVTAFTEYNFNRTSNVVPYIGTSVGVATFDFEDSFSASTNLDADGNATVFAVQAGVKWFVRPYMAISTSIGFNVASDDIYAADNNLADNLTRFRIGLRYYF